MEPSSENGIIEIDHLTIRDLNTTRKWTMLLAFLGFIFLGLLIILGIIAGTFLSAFNTEDPGFAIPESLIFISILLLAILYFFSVLFLFRFSKHTASAVHSFKKEELHKALKYLKLYFMSFGALIILALTFYIVTLIIAGKSMALIKGL
jgi:MFS family permease